MMNLLRENHNCVNEAGVIDEGFANGTADVNPEQRQILIQRSGTIDIEQKFRLGGLNVGSMRGHTGEVVETFTSRNVDVCCVQDVRW